MIGYNFNPEAANKPLGLPLARSAFGADGALHGVWTLSNARMADELNTYRSNALKAAVF